MYEDNASRPPRSSTVNAKHQSITSHSVEYAGHIDQATDTAVEPYTQALRIPTPHQTQRKTAERDGGNEAEILKQYEYQRSNNFNNKSDLASHTRHYFFTDVDE